MSSKLFDKEQAGPQALAVWKSYEARQGRAAGPEEIGDAVFMLCSPKMSLVNARDLVCD